VFHDHNTSLRIVAKLQGYNESRLKSSFRKLYGRYNDLVCDYKVPQAHMQNDLFHTLLDCRVHTGFNER
jgi:hypothetical protein